MTPRLLLLPVVKVIAFAARRLLAPCFCRISSGAIYLLVSLMNPLLYPRMFKSCCVHSWDTLVEQYRSLSLGVWECRSWFGIYFHLMSNPLHLVKNVLHQKLGRPVKHHFGTSSFRHTQNEMIASNLLAARSAILKVWNLRRDHALVGVGRRWQHTRFWQRCNEGFAPLRLAH